MNPFPSFRPFQRRLVGVIVILLGYYSPRSSQRSSGRGVPWRIGGSHEMSMCVRCYYLCLGYHSITDGFPDADLEISWTWAYLVPESVAFLHSTASRTSRLIRTPVIIIPSCLMQSELLTL